ncbi:uncharacterized protein LOC142975593 [Anticarsia gemmatalis]|uniref:uncharacterized protein LOC142975593 n=1 Tax=Anticarsia gemmatalis TaxID=129554 RepID=UPI003F7705EA
MNTEEELLSFLDLLDLDEELIDTRLKSLMERNNHTNKHLKSVIQLLQYKSLINTQEESDCENDEEFDFTIQLLKNIKSDNVDYVCKIINIVLSLNSSNIVNKSEHLIQQILMNIDISTEKPDAQVTDTETQSQTLIYLKVCGSILDAIIKKNEKLSLMFLETPLEKILDSSDDKLKTYFLTNIVPRLFEGVLGYDILDRVWNHIKVLEGDCKENALKILSCLSDYYLPTPDNKGNIKYESEIIFLYDFWSLIIFGINSEDTTVCKIAVYLSKRAIDCVIAANKDICIASETHTLFSWKKNNSKSLKNMWDNYFILIDSLEEKQSNIVLPSLKLFETIDVGAFWMNAAFNIGLKHDNTQVRLKCVEYKLRSEIKSQSEAVLLLEAMNDINIYDQNVNYDKLKSKLRELLKENISLIEILKAIPHIKWSPVPFYHLTDVLASSKCSPLHENFSIIVGILKVPCNNVVIRKAIHLNLIQFVTEHCEVNYQDLALLNSITQLSKHSTEHLKKLLSKIKIKDEEKYECFKTLSENVSNNDILLFLCQNESDYKILFKIIDEKIMKLNDVASRQYSDKKECLNEVIFLTHLFKTINYYRDESKTIQVGGHIEPILSEILLRQNKTILQYILSLFSSDISLSIEEIHLLFEEHSYDNKDLEDVLLQIYKTSILFLKQNPELDKAVLSVFALRMLQNNTIMLSKHKHEMLSLKTFLEIISNIKFKKSQNESVGRLKNIFYEKTCEVTYLLIEVNSNCLCIEELVTYIENVLECGGYGCLKWILRIVNKIVSPLTDETKFNMVQFINRVWNEIEELKSNNQYSPCMQEFVELLTHDALLKKAMYNNVVTSYCQRIIENGPVKINPLYYLVQRRSIKDHSLLIFILCEVLLYSPILRKDQRITDNLSLDILHRFKQNKINISSMEVHFNFEIQHLSVSTLCDIQDETTLILISKFITNKIDEMFKNKQRYHGNSQLHKTLLMALQNLLIITLKCRKGLEWLLNWSLDLLVKLPHQPSVRFCLEWLIALYLYIEKTIIGEEMLQILKSKNVPIISQFLITYFLLRHKMLRNEYDVTEYNFVQDFLLSHTMGQLFNVRLHAQYLATLLHGAVGRPERYEYTIAIIEKTFSESENDKTYVKLKNDYFIKNFGIVYSLNPHFIYYLLPRHCGIECEKDDFYIKDFLENVNKSIKVYNDDFKVFWHLYLDREMCFDFESSGVEVSEDREDPELMGTIQKKYIPWKNMSDIEVYGNGKKSGSQSDLIVVASLIDKLPNLGGMARTSEVFGVNTYVVDSLRHLTDKQFQGLSVSAERWINIEEVRPGRALKDYLLQKKTEGYSVVAAEQTSTSSKLQTFKFPKKTLLLLGHEKEGVPCDLLPIMDHCVEIPQQGVVRSLNVHVTAAIFVWEYARQIIL